MSRPSKPKAAPAAAEPKSPHPAAPQQPETTGAAAAAASAAAEATAASLVPKPDTDAQTRNAAGIVLRVKGPAKGRWRAGRHFGPEAVDIPVAELSDEDLLKLQGDPELTCLVVGEPD